MAPIATGIVVAKYAIGCGFLSQQFPHGFVASFVLIAGIHHVSGKEPQPTFGQRAAVALHAPGSDTDSRPAQMRNATAALFDQMSRGQLADGCIVGAHETGLHSCDRSVNKDEWHFVSLQVSEGLGYGLDRCHDEAVNLPGQKGFGFVSSPVRDFHRNTKS